MIRVKKKSKFYKMKCKEYALKHKLKHKDDALDLFEASDDDFLKAIKSKGLI